MTITIETAKIGPTAGNGASFTWSSSPVTFYSSDDVQVVYTDTNGVDYIRTEGAGSTNYSVSLTDSSSLPSTVTVTYPANEGTALTSSEYVTIKRKLDLKQEVDLENQGGYFPDTQEQALDELTMIAIQQQEEIDRSIKSAISDSTDLDMTLPTSTERASKLFGFNAEGEPIASDTVVDDALTTAFTLTLLDDATAQEFLSTLAPSGIMNLYNSAATEATSPNDAEYTTQLLFKADNDAEEEIIFAAIRGQIADITDGTEDGRLQFGWMWNGTEQYRFKLGGGETAQLLSYSDDTAADPKFQMLRKSQSPADGDIGPQMDWSGNHDGSVTSTGPVDYGYIRIQFDDVTEDSEDAHFEILQKVGGSDVEVLSTSGQTLTTSSDIVCGGDLYDGTSQIHSPIDNLSAVQTMAADAVPIDFTGIRADARRISVMCNAISTDGTEEVIIQLGPSGGFETTGYAGTTNNTNWAGSGVAINAAGGDAEIYSGIVTLVLMDSSTNTWSISGNMANSQGPEVQSIAGIKPLAAVLTQLRVTTTGTPDDWDGGSVAILVE